MDGFELNKIMGAVLGTCLFVLSMNIVAGAVFAPHTPAKPGYVVEVPDTPAAGGAQAALPPAEPIAVRLASADTAKGEAAAKKCLACHSFEKGGPNKVGPNLWNTVLNQRAHIQGFSYSAGMKEKGGTWDFESLDKFLTNPRSEVKGTSMTFAGVRRPEERADIIAYLNTLADSPKPLPKPQQGAVAPAASGAAPEADAAKGKAVPPAEASKAAPAPEATKAPSAPSAEAQKAPVAPATEAAKAKSAPPPEDAKAKVVPAPAPDTAKAKAAPDAAKAKAKAKQ